MKRGLGRGLDSLITTNSVAKEHSDTLPILNILLSKIEPNKEQPRKYFNEQALIELSESIKEHGVIQPIIVRGVEDKYMIVAGERRFRASVIANKETIPCIVKTCNNATLLQLSLIENIQRDNLNPIEEGLCYQKLKDEFLFSITDISKKVSKNKTTISNSISLLSLTEEVQHLIINNNLSVAHGKLLLSIKNPSLQIETANYILKHSLSVKEADKKIKSLLIKKTTTSLSTPSTIDYVKRFDSISKQLNSILGSNVNLKTNKKNGTGKIEISFSSEKDLNRLLSIFNKMK